MRTDEDIDTNAFTQNPRTAPAVMEPLTFTPPVPQPGLWPLPPTPTPTPAQDKGPRYPPPGLRMASRTLLCPLTGDKARGSFNKQTASPVSAV